MNIALIRVAATKRKSGGYGVALLATDPADSGQLLELATANIPAGLSPVENVLDPASQPLTVTTVLQRYQQIRGESLELHPMGVFLFHLMFRDRVADKWRELRRAASAPGASRLCTIIEFAGDTRKDPGLATLSRLPWELSFDPEEDLHVCLEHPLLRGSMLDPSLPADSWPLRILVVFGEDEQEKTQERSIGAVQERDAIETLLGARHFDVEYEFLLNPDPEGIVAACRHMRPHILHFIGHGSAAGNAGDARLHIFRQGSYRDWPAQAIRTNLRQIAPRMVFLNACLTSSVGAKPTVAPLASITDAFLKAGTLGVVGMQGEVLRTTAVPFSVELYRQILDGQSVETAVFAARRKVAQDLDILVSPEWSHPVLCTQVRPDLVLPEHSPIDGTHWKVGHMVSRVPQRLSIREAAGLSRAKPEQPVNSAVVLINGEPGCGKSHLAKWCAQLIAARGFQTLQVDFGPEKSALDLLDVLRWIRDGRRHEQGQLPTRDADWPLPAPAFEQFNHNLSLRLLGLDVNAKLATAHPGSADTGQRFNKGKTLEENFVANTLSEFRAALATAVTHRPTLLVLDQLEALDPPTLEQWLPEGLFKPVANQLVPNLYLMLVVSRSVHRSKWAWLKKVSPAPLVVDVEYFERCQWDYLARYLCRQFHEQMHGLVSVSLPGILNVHKITEKDPLRAEALKSVEEMCEFYHKRLRGSLA